jgi:hypothetical protein
MVSVDTIKNTIQSFNDDGRGKTFAEFIATIFDGKIVEIYLGDSYEEISIEQISVSYPAVFCGKVLGAYRECLILDGASHSKGQPPKLGNVVFINERAIRGLTAMDGSGTMDQMFLKSGSADADALRANFNK